MGKDSKDKHEEQSIRIALPERHWVALLAILEGYIRKTALPAIEKLKRKGTRFEEVDETQTAALVAPLMIRGVIVKELVARGVMSPEANERLGIDKLLADAEKFKKSLGPKRIE
jgi:hypothetical protein